MERLISKIDGLAVRPSGPWIQKKHFYLRRYLDIFTRGMGKRWRGNLTFIDLFAGPGRCLLETSNEEVDGSPLIALQYDFKRYIFVEKNKGLLSALEERSKKSPHYNKTLFLHGDCNAIIGALIGKTDPSSLHLVFADPTGLDLHFATIERIALERKADLFLNVQFGMDVVRNFSRYKKQGNSSKLGSFLGGDIAWNKLLKPRDAIKVYKEQIGKLGFQTVTFTDITVRNTKNAPMYFLLFASKSPRGLDFWKKVTARDHSGQLELF